MARVISRKYEELGQLGQGGQGVVYKVRHVEHKTILALKALPAYLLENQDMVARFEQESLLMTRLHHRNIARVLGTGRDEALNLSYFVMEYIQGRTLKQYLYEKGPLPLAEVLEITRQVASALDYAHNQAPPVIHRDIKPTNIMIEDHTGRAVVLDFGIAKELDDGEQARTKTGVMIGTWKYCSPEQLRHEPLSGSADVYSLGMVIYEMFTGKQFFAGLDEHAVLGRVLYDAQENEPKFDRSAPPEFVALLTKTMAKARAKRYPRMADLLNDLEACWWALDETKTIVLSTPDREEPQSEPARNEIEEIEAQIRGLEEERQRRILTALQGQVREAKERAEKAGARQVAATLFEQGIAQETSGEGHNQNRQYPFAQHAYQEALHAFTRAAEEAAAAVAWRQAEQNRQEAATASADAERYRAQDRVPAVYARALALKTQAEQAWEQRQYAQAGALYEEARNLFEDARDLAYRETLKEEAETALTQAQASKQAAVLERAEAWAAVMFEEGNSSEQRAAAALTREEFTQAREFFLAAQQKYEQAQRQARRAQQRRQEVLALAGNTQTAQQRAQAEGREVEQQEPYQKAERLRQQAATLLEANEFTGAEQLYVQAQEQYEAATQAVGRARLRQQVVRVRREAEAARLEAEAAGARHWFPAEWQAGQRQDEVGQSQETQGELAAAIESYRQATQRWERLRQAALERTEQEQAATVRQRVQLARATAQRESAESLAAKHFQEGRASEQQAEELLARKDFGHARDLYEQARQRYEQAEQVAREESLRQQTIQAAQFVHAAQSRASAAEHSPAAGRVYRQALAAQNQAEAFVAERQYSQAIQAYTQARTQYEEAVRIAEREQQQAVLRQARQHEEAARTAAEQAGAAQRLVSAWRGAEAVVGAARQHEEQGALQPAVTLYQDAAQRFVRLQHEAQEQGAQEKARIAQQQALLAKAQAQAASETAIQVRAEELAGAVFAEAATLTQRAESALSKEEFLQAEERYLAASEQYRRASQLAQTEALRRKATDSAQLLEAVQQRAAALGVRAGTNERSRNARDLQRQAGELFQAQDYGRATQCYEQARTLYEAVIRDAEEELQRALTHAHQAVEAARTKAEEGEAPQRLAEQWATLLQAEQQARASEAHGDLIAAVKSYQEVTSQYIQIRDAALEHTARERVTRIQRQMLTAKEEAKEWKEWAEKGWEEALRQETVAERAFRARHYGEAERTYQQAALRYARVKEEGEAAHQVARETLRQRTEHARQVVATARTEAEHAGARERATELYQRATTAQKHGEEQWAQQQYQQAEQHYLEAARLYTDAGQQAQTEILREEALQAKQHLQRVQAAATGAGAREFASTDFDDATQITALGENAWRQEAFARARDAYREAHQRYEQAQQTAQLEQQRRHIKDVAQIVQAARQRAEGTQTWPEAQAVYQQATVLQQQAEALVATHTFDQAELRYGQAREYYEEASTVAERLHLQQTVTRTRQQAEAALDTARHAGAAQRFTTAWREIDEIFQRARQYEIQTQWSDAIPLYEQATQRCTQVQREAEQAAAHEEAQWQQRVRVAQQRAQQSRNAAEQAEGPQLAQTQYATAMHAYQTGEQSLKARQWTDAEARFAQAHEKFLHTLAEAQNEKAKQVARAARDEALKTQQETQKSRAPEVFPQRVAEISALLQKGEQAFQRVEFSSAQQDFQRGTALLQQLAQDTVRHLQKKQAEQTKRQAVALQSQTQKIKGRQHKQAKKALQQGDRLFAQEHYQEAATHYETAAALWSALQQTAAQAATAPAAAKQEAPSVAVSVARFPLPYAWIGGAVLVLLIGLYVVNPFSSTKEKGREEKKDTVLSPKPASKPLQITQATPDPAGKVAVDEGKNQTFVVAVDSAAPGTLQYSWRVNSQEEFSGTGKEAASWTYHPRFDEGEGRDKEIEVVVTDTEQQTASTSWRVQVQNVNRPPQITVVAPQPGKPITARAGEVKEFSIEATDPDGDDRLAYLWSVDGKEVSQEKQWKFQVPSDGGAHTIAVAVSDEAGAKVQQEWQVSLKSLPLVITRTSPPTTQEVIVEEGKSLTFAVGTEDAGKEALRYSWRIDGKAQSASGEQWVYRPGFSDATEKPKTVEVIVANRENQTVKETWQVRVQNVNQPPNIVKTSPGAGQTVQVASGGVQDFTVNAADPDRDDRLAYVWSLDDKEVSRSERWQFRAPATESAHRVTVEVQDREGLKKQQEWQVLVKAVPLPDKPPEWRTTQPRDDKLTVRLGDSVMLSATAELLQKTEEKATIRYVWSRNSESVQEGQSDRFRFDETRPGTYQVAVVAIGPTGLKSGPRRWTIEVRPPDVPPPPPPEPGELRETEVREWLEGYRRAWEEKSTDRLVALGALSSQDATKLQQVLAVYKEFHVVFTDVDIQRQGTQATVSFQRVDTMEGKQVSHPGRTTLRLEKRTDGQIVIRK